MMSEQHAEALAPAAKPVLARGRLALAGLIICELFLFAAVLLSTTGVLFWAALAMLIPTLAFTWQLQGGAGGSGALGASLQRVNGKQIDLRLGNEKHSDAPAILRSC